MRVRNTPYSKMATILVFFCLRENEPLLPRLRENALTHWREINILQFLKWKKNVSAVACWPESKYM